MRVPFELRRFRYCRNVSDPIIIFAQPVSTIPLLRQEFSIVSNSPQTRLRSRLNFLAFSNSEQLCSRRLRILTNNEACLSNKHWNLGCLSPRFLGKLFIFSSRIDFLSHLLCDHATISADILLPNVPHVHIDCTSFSVSAPPLPRGISSLRRSLDEVSLLKFLVVFCFTAVASTFQTSSSSRVVLIDEFLHIFQTINARVFIDLLHKDATLFSILTARMSCAAE